MSNKKRPPYWRNEEYWVCPNHLPVTKLPAQLDSCWYSRCPSTRPKAKSPQKLSLTLRVYLGDCEWYKCASGENDSKAMKLPGRKYCSHKCRKDKARWAYRERKKQERAVA